MRLVGVLPEPGRLRPTVPSPWPWGRRRLLRLARVRAVPTSGSSPLIGSRIFFTTPGAQAGEGAAGTLYVRENGRRTRLVSVSKRSTPDPEGTQPATFLAASPDGRVVLFRSTEKLTDDANANNGNVGGLKHEIYRYDIDADVLTNLSAEMPSAEGLVGTDRAFTTVYFGGNNSDIYMWRNGVTKRVAAGISAGGSADLVWPARLQITGKQSDVSPDGRFMVYRADQPQAGIDPGGTGQLFLYDADAGQTICLTCTVNGDASGESRMRPFQSGGAFIRPYLSRNFTDDSTRVFFETPKPSSRKTRIGGSMSTNTRFWREELNSSRQAAETQTPILAMRARMGTRCSSSPSIPSFPSLTTIGSATCMSHVWALPSTWPHAESNAPATTVRGQHRRGRRIGFRQRRSSLTVTILPTSPREFVSSGRAHFREETEKLGPNRATQAVSSRLRRRTRERHGSR